MRMSQSQQCFLYIKPRPLTIKNFDNFIAIDLHFRDRRKTADLSHFIDIDFICNNETRKIFTPEDIYSLYGVSL